MESTKLARNGYDEQCVVSSISVSDAMSKLKGGKGDGNTELTTDHFKYAYACPELSVYVSLLFTGLQGTLPTDMGSSTVLAIPKERNGQSDSDN